VIPGTCLRASGWIRAGDTERTNASVTGCKADARPSWVAPGSEFLCVRIPGILVEFPVTVITNGLKWNHLIVIASYEQAVYNQPKETKLANHRNLRNLCLRPHPILMLIVAASSMQNLTGDAEFNRLCRNTLSAVLQECEICYEFTRRLWYQAEYGKLQE
jgi:hypothetical protein